MKKVSVKAQVRDARAGEAKAVRAVMQPYTGSSISGVKSLDSFVNFAHKLGIGADNVLSYSSYGYNPITRNRNLLEWIHRGSWLGGQAVDVVADDMTRAGVYFHGELDPEDQEQVEAEAVRLGIWDKLNENIKWGRLYGGAISVMLIDGQDPRTPLNLDSVGPEQFMGLAVFDRWMLEPSLEDLVTDLGPFLGHPKYYRVGPNAPSLRGSVIHYSRVVLRHLGSQLSYQQSLTENLWGASVLERLYDRMIGFDSATTGMTQLVFKSFLRTLKIKDLRSVIAAGGKAMEGLTAYAETMRRYQGVEGLSLIDGEDELEVQASSAFTGVGDVVGRLGEQLSGALQIPLVRLFGQSPAGLNASGESDLRNYYDSINQRQEKDMKIGVTTIYKLIAQSLGVTIPDNFSVCFNDLWDLDAVEKSTIAQNVSTAIDTQFQGGVIGRQTALKELRSISRTTGVFGNITQQAIDEADDEVLPPAAELAMGQEHELEMQSRTQKHAGELADKSNKVKLQTAAAKKLPASGAKKRVPMKH